MSTAKTANRTITDEEFYTAVNAYRNSRRKNPRNNPDTAARCTNTNHQGKHCLAAQVMVDLGHPVPGYQEDYCSAAVESLFSHQRNQLQLHVPFSPEQTRTLTRLQHSADEGLSWGRAVQKVLS